ncbi:MAG: c-type cytochrome domain-containing protein, partial [Planctomycetota bacterium]
MSRALWALSVFALLPGAVLPARAADPAPDFNRDVRPVLADKCYHCHGPDASTRKAGLRLDTPEGARALLESGRRAIDPSNLPGSEMIVRMHSKDPDE